MFANSRAKEKRKHELKKCHTMCILTYVTKYEGILSDEFRMSQWGMTMRIPQCNSVDDNIYKILTIKVIYLYDFDWVFLEIPLKKCIVGMLLTCLHVHVHVYSQCLQDTVMKVIHDFPLFCYVSLMASWT